jgi:hypothetical protein
MEAIEELLIFYINHSSAKSSTGLVNGLKIVSMHYNEIIQIVRWTFPCVVMLCVLLCLLFETNKRTE